MTGPSLRERAADITWYHSIELAPGFVTPGIDSGVTPDSAAYRAARSVKRATRYARSWARDRARPHEHPAQGRAVFHASA